MTSSSSKRVYLQSEAYKGGWVAGFYDCMRDDGLFYGAYVSLQWIPSDTTARADALRTFEKGYWDGRSLRRGSKASRKIAPPSSSYSE